MAKGTKIQHKRSNQLVNAKAKAPDCSVLDYGELAVNFNAKDPTLFLKTDENIVIRIGNDEGPKGEQGEKGDEGVKGEPGESVSGSGGAETEVGDTAPDPATEGQLWWNTIDGNLYVYFIDEDGDEQWVPASPGQQGNKGEPGSVSWDDVTDEELEDLKGEKGDEGEEGEKGEIGSIEGAETAVGALPPDPATPGRLWWDTGIGTLYLYYEDDDGTLSWVPASPSIQGAKGEPGAGGGGAVDSVNGETGVVVLSIVDMNDYAEPDGLADGDVLVYSSSDGTWNASQLPAGDVVFGSLDKIEDQ